MKRYKSPSINQIPAELIQAGDNTLRSEIHKFINSVWNEEKLPQQWKEFISVLINIKDVKTDCSNYRRILLLPTTYKILSNIFVSKLTPHVGEIIEDHQREFQRNRSITDQIFCIRQILEKKGRILGHHMNYL
jgi:hypothetical protein